MKKNVLCTRQTLYSWADDTSPVRGAVSVTMEKALDKWKKNFCFKFLPWYEEIPLKIFVDI